MSDLEICSQLFDWSYADKQSFESLDRGQISRWINGTEDLPKQIFSHAISNINAAAKQYEKSFLYLLDPLKGKPKSIMESISNNFQQMLLAFPVQFFSENQTDYEVVTRCFVTALIYDGLPVQQRLFLDLNIASELSNTIKRCKKSNSAFRTYHIVDILLRDNHPLLREAMNRIEEGAGDRFKQDVEKHIATANHSPYQEVKLAENKLVIMSIYLAYQKHCRNRNQSFFAGELEFCRAIVRCDSGKTITRMRELLGPIADDEDAWDKLLEDCNNILYGSTVI